MINVICRKKRNILKVAEIALNIYSSDIWYNCRKHLLSKQILLTIFHVLRFSENSLFVIKTYNMRFNTFFLMHRFEKINKQKHAILVTKMCLLFSSFNWNWKSTERLVRSEIRISISIPLAFTKILVMCQLTGVGGFKLSNKSTNTWN